MSSIVTRTIYGSALQSLLYTGKSFTMVANTTLNEKLSIQSGVAPAAAKIPQLLLACIGNGGHRYETGSDSIPIMTSIKHDPTDAALYKQIPWVLRPTSNDLSTTERAKYALRKARTYNSVNYIAYYGRRLDLATPTQVMEIETITNGTSTSAEFVPSSANLNPTPLEIEDSGATALNGQYANVRLPVSLNISAAEVAEIISACEIIYGDARYAIISELAFVSGVDKVITIDGGASFTEVIAAQVNAFISDAKLLQYSTDGVSGSYDLGSNSPLLRTL